MKKRSIAAAAGALILAAVSTWAILVVSDQSDFDQQMRRLGSVGHDLESRFFLRHAEELGWLARLEPVRRALAKPGPADPELDRILKETTGLLGLSGCYVLRPDGLTVAADTPSFVGSDLSNRTYFRTALSGLVDYDLQVGPETKTKGLYASAPVYDAGRVIGAVAFRTDVAQLNAYLADMGRTVLLDAGGATFSSSVEPTLQTEVWRWSDPTTVSVAGVSYRVARYSLTVVPGYTLLSLRPQMRPWTAWIVADVLILLLTALLLLGWQQYKLVSERADERRERRQREVLLANLMEGIAVVDPRGELLWTNPAFRRLVELEAGGPAPRLPDLWDRPGVGPWRDVLEGRRDWVVFESVLRGRSGGWTPVTAAFTVAEDQFLLSILDRTEHYRADKLLSQSQKLTVLGQLSGGIAHDLNNLLGVLTGMTDLVKMSLPPGDGLHESVDLMQTTLVRACALADRMLNFARQTPIDRRALEMNALLRELRFLARSSLPGTVEIDLDLSAGAATVTGDGNLLMSALLNLVLNAAEALEHRGTVRISGRPEERGQYLVTVEDQGPGMDKATLARIFEPFFTTKGGQGTGLGLSLVRRTIQDHQGTIRVDSQPGQGTRVIVSLPAEKNPAGA